AYQAMVDYPAAFAHLTREEDKKFEIYESHKSGTPVILPPRKFRSLAEYNVTGAYFNPAELKLDPGLSESEWLAVGRAITHISGSTFWWIGDFLLYGFRAYGKKVSYDLAQQATSFSRNVLYSCALVAKRYPPERRIEALSFYHHSRLAKFAPELA